MPIRAEIRIRAKIIVTSLSRDIYSDRPKKQYRDTCVIHVLHMYYMCNTCVMMGFTININLFKETGSRFSAFIKMLFFCRDMLYRLCKQYDHVIVMSKNQSAHSPGSNLINVCANNFKLINHGIKPSGQE